MPRTRRGESEPIVILFFIGLTIIGAGLFWYYVSQQTRLSPSSGNLVVISGRVVMFGDRTVEARIVVSTPEQAVRITSINGVLIVNSTHRVACTTISRSPDYIQGGGSAALLAVITCPEPVSPLYVMAIEIRYSVRGGERVETGVFSIEAP